MIEDVADAAGGGLAREGPSDRSRDRPGWSLVLPLKGGPGAKSRLGAPAALATAIALDCLDAVLATPGVARVVVVTADDGMAAAAHAAGAQVVRESVPGAGLTEAIADGLTHLSTSTAPDPATSPTGPELGAPCAVLLGDLPALRPADLDEALRRVEQTLVAPAGPAMVFVPDADGVGTVLLAAARPWAMRPSFGPDSAARHTRAGAARLDLDLPGLRRDVDTRADLSTATGLGLGPRTTAALTTPLPPPPASPPA